MRRRTGGSQHALGSVWTHLLALVGLSVVLGLILQLAVRAPRALARPAPVDPTPRPRWLDVRFAMDSDRRERLARVRARRLPFRIVPKRTESRWLEVGFRIVPKRPRRRYGALRLATFLMICSALAVVPFALNAYAQVPELLPVPLIPTEESEPLPPSYELGVLAEAPPFDASEIMEDSAMFRSGDPKLAAIKRASKGAYILPVPGNLVSAAELAAPHHDYPAADLSVPTGTQVFAAHAGVVETVTTRGKCGLGVVVQGADGYSYIYCHGSSILTQVGASVKAGDVLMLSGNTGHSTGPHLHFGIESSAGQRLCPQSLLVSWLEGGEMSPGNAASDGCSYRTEDKKKRERRRTSGRIQTISPSTRDDDEDSGSDPWRPEPRPRPGTPTPTPEQPAPSPDPTPDPTPEPTPDPTPEPVVEPIVEGATATIAEEG